MAMETEAKANERLDPRELLEHVGWVRRLARSLVRGTDAEELAQETLMAALRHPPLTARPVRPWLGTVLGNFRRTARRSERRRDEQARQVPAPDAVPSPETMLERMEAARLLAELVAGLSEPRRTTLLLGYFEGGPGGSARPTHRDPHPRGGPFDRPPDR
jgi:DNA-directed RNA polymerase specialized sigma24 family protein